MFWLIKILNYRNSKFLIERDEYLGEYLVGLDLEKELFAKIL